MLNEIRLTFINEKKDSKSEISAACFPIIDDFTQAVGGQCYGDQDVENA